MQISKKRLIDLVRAAYDEGTYDGYQACILGYERECEILWLESESLYGLRTTLHRDKS